MILGNVFRKIGNIITKCSSQVFALLLLVLVPLFVENKYFNITNAKSDALLLSVGGFLIVSIIGVLLERKNPFSKPTTIDTAVIFLCISAMLSCILSDNFSDSFWGTNGWRIGGVVFLSLSVAYFILINHLELKPVFWRIVALCYGLILAIGIINSMGIDVFDLHRNIAHYQFFDYISTIGNVNWLVGFLCLTVPLFTVFYVSSNDIVSKISYLIYLIFACFNVVLCASDGLILGLGVCALFAIPYFARSTQRFRKLLLIGLVFGLALVTVRCTPIFSQKLSQIDGIYKELLALPVCLSITAVCAVLLLTFTLVKGKSLDSFSKILGIVLFAAVLLAAAYFTYKTITGFNDNWGTKRGAIWRISIEQFKSFTPIQKLFGVGPEMLKTYYTPLKDYLSLRVLVSHSEPMQMLLTTGIVGLASWAFLWLNIILFYFKKKLWNSDDIAFFLPLVAYLGQSFVNSAQSLGVAVCFIIAVAFINKMKKE